MRSLPTKSCLTLALPFALAPFALAPFALALSACSQEKSEEAVSESAEAAPDVGGIVAPGVAFAYRFAFTLPARAISQVQEEHATACRKLGTSRCRVTGVAFDQPREGETTARTDFLLAPDLAHSFGNDAVAAVERAKGKLENASVSGEDAGGTIKLSQTDSAAMAAEVERIEARLSAKGLGKQERAELSRRVEELRDSLRGEEQLRRSKEAAIASTPVSFAYSSQGVLSGGNPFTNAAAASWNSAQGLFTFLLVLAGMLLPWLAPVALVVVLIRHLRRRRTIAEPAS